MDGSAQIGASASGYVGDQNLGGGSFGFGKIDISPLMDLARYTFLYHKAEYDQRQKDAEATAKEISDSTSYDLTTSIPKDAKVIQGKYDKLLAFMRDNPDALDYRNKEMWKRYKEMRNDLDNDLKSGKVRDTLNMLRTKEIQDEKDPGRKAYLQEQLDKEIDATDIRTPLKYSSQYDISPVTLNPAPQIEVQTTDFGKNFFGQANWKLFDVRKLNQMASATANGLDQLANFESQDWFKQLSPDKQEEYKKQYESQTASRTGKFEPIYSAQNFNAALKTLPAKYFTTDASGVKTLNWNELKNSDNSIISGVVQQAEAYNQMMDQMTEWIKKGYFKDNFGGNLHFGNDASGLKEGDYKKINIDDGLSAEELMKMRMLGVTPAPERTIKVTETDLDIKKQQIAADWAKIGVERDKLNMANTQSIIGADAVLREVSDVIKGGIPYKYYNSSTNKWEDAVRIADPNLLKEFATIDKDGNIVNRPDEVKYDPERNNLSLIYFEKYTEDDSKGHKKGDIVIEDGKHSIARQVPVEPTQWFGNIVGRKFSADDKGAVNNFVDQIFGKFGRNLKTLADGYLGGATTPGPNTKTQVSISTSEPKLKQVKGRKGKIIYVPDDDSLPTGGKKPTDEKNMTDEEKQKLISDRVSKGWTYDDAAQKWVPPKKQ